MRVIELPHLHQKIEMEPNDRRASRFTGLLERITMYEQGCILLFYDCQPVFPQSYDWESEMQSLDLTKLCDFHLSSYQISLSGAQLLGRFKWPNLQQFSLNGCRIKLEGLKELLKNENLRKLVKLDLTTTSIGDQGMNTIATAQNFPLLKMLSVCQIGISGYGLRAMPDCIYKGLKNLDLNGNMIGSRGIKYLVKTDLPILQKLNLTNCYIGSEGARHLIKQNWPSLIDLILHFPSDFTRHVPNNIGFDGWCALANFSRKRKQYFKIMSAFFQPGYSIACWISVVLNHDYYFQSYRTPTSGEIGFRKYSR